MDCTRPRFVWVCCLGHLQALLGLTTVFPTPEMQGAVATVIGNLASSKLRFSQITEFPLAALVPSMRWAEEHDNGAVRAAYTSVLDNIVSRYNDGLPDPVTKQKPGKCACRLPLLSLSLFAGCSRQPMICVLFWWSYPAALQPMVSPIAIDGEAAAASEPIAELLQFVEGGGVDAMAAVCQRSKRAAAVRKKSAPKIPMSAMMTPYSTPSSESATKASQAASDAQLIAAAEVEYFSAVLRAAASVFKKMCTHISLRDYLSTPVGISALSMLAVQADVQIQTNIADVFVALSRKHEHRAAIVQAEAVPVLTSLAASSLLPFAVRKSCASVLKRIAADEGLAHAKFDAIGVAQSVLQLQSLNFADDEEKLDESPRLKRPSNNTMLMKKPSA